MISYSDIGTLARVYRVVHERKLFFRLPNGSFGSIEGSDLSDFREGDVVLLFENRVEHAPESLWMEESWISVVRIKSPEGTIIETSGQLRLIPTNDTSYEVGNTVEVNNLGVIRVLSEKPIRFLDLPEVDDSEVEQFIVSSDDSDLTFEDFGGLPEIVRRARDLIEVPLKHKDALSRIGARNVKGVLFTGAPGTGKTMLARIIAKESQATFFHISGPEVVSKWHGQSEELLRKIFDRAKRATSAIIFFDEIDSVASQRNEDAHEASRRLVAQLLTLMDGFKRDTNIVVIATTNRPQDIDTALRRPGRFDWEIEFPLPNLEDRKKILETSARRLRTIDSLPHEIVAQQTESWSAADLAAIWTEAARFAVTDDRDAIMAEDYLAGFAYVDSQRRRVHSQNLSKES